MRRSKSAPGIALAVAVLSLLSIGLAGRLHGEEWVWPAIRAALFGLVGVAAWQRREREAGLGSAVAALGFVALFGWKGLDWALAALVVGHLRLSREALTQLAFGVGLAGALALAVNREWGPLPFGNRNHYAVFTEIVLPFLAWQAKRQESRLAWVGGALLLGVSFAAGSRVGVVLLGGEMLWLAWRWGGAKKLAWGAMGVVALGSVFVALSPGERLRNPWQGDHRVEIWSSAVEMIREKPWGGWGVDQFPKRYPAFAKFDNGEFVNAAHSDWLEWGVEAGIGGLLVPGMGLGWYLRRYRHSAAVWGILFGALHAMVDFPWQQPGFLVLSAVLAGTFTQYGEKTSRSSPHAAQPANAAG